MLTAEIDEAGTESVVCLKQWNPTVPWVCTEDIAALTRAPALLTYSLLGSSATLEVWVRPTACCGREKKHFIFLPDSQTEH